MAKAYYTITRTADTNKLVRVLATSDQHLEYDTGCLLCENGAWRGHRSTCPNPATVDTRITRNIKLTRVVADRQQIKGTNRVHWNGRYEDFYQVVREQESL